MSDVSILEKEASAYLKKKKAPVAPPAPPIINMAIPRPAMAPGTKGKENTLLEIK